MENETKVGAFPEEIRGRREGRRSQEELVEIGAHRGVSTPEDSRS